MKNQTIKEFEDMGTFTRPFDESAPRYNAKMLSEYCKKHNKKPNELTVEELQLLQTNRYN
ncbi:MAG: hypothetical protein J6K92_12410 [Oscillospiraceae bacterium]|nr:hypothetical protein [Oscillospiraceae bacterium]